MTVTAQTPVNSYLYSGSSMFVYAFQVLQAGDLVVTVDGVQKTLGVDYTATGVGAQAGGSITYLGALTTGQNVTLRRVTTRARAIDYQPNGDFLSPTVNADFDRLWQAMQENDALAVQRALRVPIGETAVDIPAATVRANYLLGFDSSGNPVAVAPVSGSSASLAADLVSLLQANKNAGQVGYNYLLAYAAGTLGNRLRQTGVSVVDAGGVSGSDVAAAVTAASVQSREVFFPPGTWAAATTPTITGNSALRTGPGAILSGAGFTALGNTTGALYQMLQQNTAGTDFATQYFRRNASHTGGAPGFATSCLRVETYVSNAAATNYEWAFTAKMDNSATGGGQNVAAYLQGIKRSTGPTWGAVIEVIEANAINDPTTGTVALEIDMNCNGTDANNARIGLDLAVRKTTGVGAAAVAGFGYRIQNGGDASSLVNIGYGFATGMTAICGFATHTCTITQSAFKMAQGQNIAFNAASTRTLSYNGGALVWTGASGNASAISDSGAYIVGANQVVGSRDTGYGAMTGTADKATAFATGTVTLAQLASRVLSLQASLTAHGLIGA